MKTINQQWVFFTKGKKKNYVTLDMNMVLHTIVEFLFIT